MCWEEHLTYKSISEYCALLYALLVFIQRSILATRNPQHFRCIFRSLETKETSQNLHCSRLWVSVKFNSILLQSINKANSFLLTKTGPTYDWNHSKSWPSCLLFSNGICKAVWGLVNKYWCYFNNNRTMVRKLKPVGIDYWFWNLPHT